jgi:nicotinate phosphoribosyltransferase
VKKIVRFYNGHDRMMGDLLAHVDEPLPCDERVRAHHPMYDYMKKTYWPPYSAEELMVPVFLGGKQVYPTPPLEETRELAVQQIESLEAEYKRFSNPHLYKVSLSDNLYEIKQRLLKHHQEGSRS